MADRLDVAQRLAEGRPAVEHTQSYVWACQQIGYQHPELTARPTQIHDWYASEDGLDLAALDGDCARLRAAEAAATEALRRQRVQVVELAAAWHGPGADAAVGYLQRHCAAASTLVAEIRAAAQRCESLRDTLWQLVDAKVATALAIDDRTLAQRPTWLAAAGTVMGGVGDRSSAEEVLRHQVKPYVDNDIRNDWATAMRSTVAGVRAAYDAVIERFCSAAYAHFELPDDRGPGWNAVGSESPIVSEPPAALATAAGPPRVLPPSQAPLRSAVAPASSTYAPPAPTPPEAGVVGGDGFANPSASGSSAGRGGLGGLGELADRIVAAMGGLVGTAVGELGGLLRSDDPAVDVADVADVADAADAAAVDDEHHGEHDKAEKLVAEKEAEKVEAVREAGRVAEERPDGPAGPVARPAAPPVADPPPVVAPPPHGDVLANGPDHTPAAEPTPCEIAADELPKAGQ
ncbi:hypothetical protein MB901379_00972 [Mycobacterium basiliense]|uniref:Uncharacterized protein n=1 Tax=Mycobacterium basiliense TaxID=2094119 RepID=A0A3S4BTR7_9MYCO|nr:hypothetical protein [Mycobacterium basiliense]VDM87433.1 hypothetical protein MB901379_00972 [Mycobacterium basiliense]